MNDQASSSQPRSAMTLPPWLIAMGVLLILGSVVLSIRLIWEMTSLTWQRGPQMIGFSLAHGAGALLFFAPFALFIWLLGCFSAVIAWKIKRKPVLHRNWIVVSLAALALGLLLLPQNFWNEIFISQLAGSPHSTELLVYAAGVGGDDRVVEGLLKRGVPVNATDRQGDTALHFAASAGRVELVSYLIAHGANVNAVNLYGDSPLQTALTNHQINVQRILISNGAKDLKGSAEQRDRATKAIVERDIEEMNANRR